MPFSTGIFGTNYTFVKGKAPLTRELKQLMRRREMKTLRTLMIALNGVAPGASASANVVQVANNGTSSGVVTGVAGLGGQRALQTRSMINRVTTAADVTYITNLMTKRFGPLTYPRDRSGNGK